jgi:hypothetical protein
VSKNTSACRNFPGSKKLPGRKRMIKSVTSSNKIQKSPKVYAQGYTEFPDSTKAATIRVIATRIQISSCFLVMLMSIKR